MSASPARANLAAPPNFPRACGFTLIEVLLAILILALGAGGIITMQLHALRLAQQSALRASAVQFASELAEHLQGGDPDTLLFSSAASAEASGDTAAMSSAEMAGSCYRQRCAASDMTAFTQSDWWQRLQLALPQARVTVCRDSVGDRQGWECDHSGNSTIVIKIGWHARLASGPNAAAPAVVMATGW